MHCVVCNWKGQQWRTYNKRRARCPRCGSLERHRIAMYHMKRLNLYPAAVEPTNCLCISIHPCFSKFLPRAYFVQTIEIEGGHGRRKGTVCRLPYPDQSIDMIIQLHVLEHVKDDLKATAEISRVLKPGGWYVSQVPCEMDEPTVEWPSPKPPHGHWRHYGATDYAALLGRCGLQDVQIHLPGRPEQNMGRMPLFTARGKE